MSFLDVAVIVVSPAALQVTLPLASIVATPSLEDFHVTDASALAGLGVMDNWIVLPFFPLASPLMAILVRTTSASFTVIFWVPDFPPASAVIVASQMCIRDSSNSRFFINTLSDNRNLFFLFVFHSASIFPYNS